MSFENYFDRLRDVVVGDVDREQEGVGKEPCWVSGTIGFLWFLLASAYILVFILTLLLAFKMVAFYGKLGKDYRKVYKHGWGSPRGSREDKE